jgi:hypothetical protein
LRDKTFPLIILLAKWVYQLVKTKKRKHPTKLATKFEFIPKLAPQHLQQEPTSYFLKPLKSLPILAHFPFCQKFPQTWNQHSSLYSHKIHGIYITRAIFTHTHTHTHVGHFFAKYLFI